MSTLFISDLHLDPARPEITTLFLRFLATEAREADTLYILGDLFEAWIGDDDPDPHHARVVQGLCEFADAGVPLHFMHGNRDFLIGGAFAARTGAILLPDPTVIDLYGTPTLLMHGDLLCTDDHDYQRFRAMVRDPVWQREFLAQPLEKRKAFAQQVRMESQAKISATAPDIMDVNQKTVERVMLDHGVRHLIHGHTHRPNVHHFTANGAEMTRIVLGDWYEQGSVLRSDADGHWLRALSLQ